MGVVISRGYCAGLLLRFVSAIALVVTALGVPASAAHRLCALRDGPEGPCTCEMDASKPGEFKPVAKSWCRKAPPKATATKAAPPSLPATDAMKPDKTTQSSTDPVAPPAAATAKATAPVATAAISTKLDAIRARGALLCGTNTGLLGFASRTPAGEWAGIDADFCRAVAAAIFGDANKVEFVSLETNERFDALQNGKVDILSRNTTWTMTRDIDMGLDFAGVLYFDGQGFLTSDERGLVSAQQLAGAKVCVEGNTTSETNMSYYFKSHAIPVEMKSFPTHADLLKAYADGICDAYTGDRSTLFADRAGFPEPDKHAVLPEVISKEPLGPAVLQTDRAWVDIVRWTLSGLINAEEVGLTKANAAGEPTGDMKRLIEGAGVSGEKLGLSKTWLRDVVSAVGNYAEMFDGNVGSRSPLGMDRGLNALWKHGGILYAPPMW